MQVECHKELDKADAEYECIKKIFDLVAGPADYTLRYSPTVDQGPKRDQNKVVFSFVIFLSVVEKHTIQSIGPVLTRKQAIR